MSQQYNMHLIYNTHWDREWRWSFRETQLRLKTAMDILIDTMEKDRRFASFHTDSQASMVEDYLDIRPENKERVVKLVEEGRLQVGPWYTLPAEHLVSGESLTRNLMLGHSIAKELGGVMKAAYNIFSWGQVSQLPQIYRQFGMDTILFYRGIDKSTLDSLEFTWEAPDGTKALGVTFGAQHRLNFWFYVYKPYMFGDKDAGFSREAADGFLTNLCDSFSEDRNHHLINQPNYKDKEKAMAGMKNLLNTITDKASTGELLLLQGFDLENPDPSVPDLIDYINENIDYGKIKVSTIPEYIEILKKELSRDGKINTLPAYKGEMLEVERVGAQFGPLFPGVFSARMPIKLLNSECEMRLTGWAEPSSVWAMLYGAEYPQRAIQIAWKTLFQNQQHDGIGGCHVDRVTVSTNERFRDVIDISEALTRDALQELVDKIDYSNIHKNEVGVVVFNPHQKGFTGVVEATIDIPLQGGQTLFQGGYKRDASIDILDSNGDCAAKQMITQFEETVFAHRKYGGNTSFRAARFHIIFEAENVPAFGYKKYIARFSPIIHRPVEKIAHSANTMENEFLKAEINGDGTIQLLDKKTGELYKGLHYFEDGGEQGGPLIYTPPEKDSIYTTIGSEAAVALVENGPLKATYRIERTWLLPAALSTDLRIQIPQGNKWIERGYISRSEDKAALKISTEVTLKKGSRILEFKTVIDNQVRDHRLRLLFPTNIDANTVFADSPYDIVERPVFYPDSSGWYEEALKTYPSQSLVDMSKGNRGMAVLHAGIPEYEVTTSSERSIALTLLRCFGIAGGGAETYRPEPLAQCLGVHEFRYAVYTHSSDVTKAEILVDAAEFKVPVRVAQCSQHSGELADGERSFFSLGNTKIVFSAMKKAEDGNGVILRFYNPERTILNATLTTMKEIKSAKKVTLEEVFEADLNIRDKTAVELSLRPGEIYTVLLEL